MHTYLIVLPSALILGFRFPANGMELTSRENQILALVVDGSSSLDIAGQLNISIRTMDAHRKNISAKLGTSSLIAFTKYAIKKGMIEGFQYTSPSQH